MTLRIKKGKQSPSVKEQFLIVLISYLFAFIGGSLQAKQIFVAPGGDDSNDGTMASPFWSVQRAQTEASLGDTVYIRGGTYSISPSDISQLEQNLFACISFLDKDGTPGNPIKYWAYPGETPLFDFSAVAPANQRVVGFWVEADYVHLKGIEITGIQVTITAHTESYCVYSWGSHNIFEQISMHDNKGTGLRHRRGGDNLFLNCDAYNNHDDVSQNGLGGNTDGFGCHPNSSGTGNVFKGCRAWFNSDDGFDCIRSDAAITFDSCWAMYNGYSQSFQDLGDGTGFKAGGYAYDEASQIPNPVPVNTVSFCIAVRNRANGFYSNHHLNGNVWLNNTAYKNAFNYNMVNRESPQSQNINVNGYDHVLKNNLGYLGRSGETAYLDTSQNTVLTNSFGMNLALSSADFVSLDEAQLMAPRKADGSLPDIDFMAIDPASPLMNAGTDIGFPFAGSSPEPGALEQTLPATTSIDPFSHSTSRISYPNPLTDILYLSQDWDIRELVLTDMLGKKQQLKISNHSVDMSHLPLGVYILTISTQQGHSLNEKIFIRR